MKQRILKAFRLTTILMVLLLVTGEATVQASPTQDMPNRPDPRHEHLQPPPPPPPPGLPDFSFLDLNFTPQQIAAIEKLRESHLKNVLALRKRLLAKTPAPKKQTPPDQDNIRSIRPLPPEPCAELDALRHEDNVYFKKILDIMTPEQIAMLLHPQGPPMVRGQDKPPAPHPPEDFSEDCMDLW